MEMLKAGEAAKSAKSKLAGIVEEQVEELMTEAFTALTKMVEDGENTVELDVDDYHLETVSEVKHLLSKKGWKTGLHTHTIDKVDEKDHLISSESSRTLVISNAYLTN